MVATAALRASMASSFDATPPRSQKQNRERQITIVYYKKKEGRYLETLKARKICRALGFQWAVNTYREGGIGGFTKGRTAAIRTS